MSLCAILATKQKSQSLCIGNITTQASCSQLHWLGLITALNFFKLTCCFCFWAEVSSGDWAVGVIGIPFALFSLIDLQSALKDWSRTFSLLISLLYILAVVVGFGPTLYFPLRKKSVYHAWREWFVLNSLFWALLRYPFTMYRCTVMASELAISHTAFATKALLLGPHVMIIMMGIGYPLRVDLAFPFVSLAAIGATASCGWVHSKLIQSPAAQPHLEFLASQLCSSGFYKEFVLVTTGFPCTSDSILLNLWCTEGGITLFLMTFVILIEQSNRRERFFKMTGLEEPYPLVFGDPLFSHTTLVAVFIVLGVGVFYLLTLLP